MKSLLKRTSTFVFLTAMFAIAASRFAIANAQGVVDATPTPQSTASSVADAATAQCERLIRAKLEKPRKDSDGLEIEETVDDRFRLLENQTRFARCVLSRADAKAAREIMLHAVRSNEMPSYDEIIVNYVSPEWPAAMMLLAASEYAIGKRDDAERHATLASQLDQHVLKSSDRRISQSDLRIFAPKAFLAERIAKEERVKSHTALLTSLSVDQRKLYLERGPADHIESFDAGSYRTETWWYGRDSYNAGYTFTNGRLTSEYHP